MYLIKTHQESVMKKFILFIIIILLTACNQNERELFSIEGAWVREAPPNATALAGYVTIKNNTAQTQILSSAKSEQFKMVEIHRTIVENGVAKMRRQKNLPIPASGSLKLEPGSYHLMLMKPKSAIKANDDVEITLCYYREDDPNKVIQEVDIILPVKKP